MGFLDKLKSTFFEEEYVEVEEKQKKHSPKPEVKKEHPVVKEEIKKEEKQEVVKEERVEPVIKKVEEKVEDLKEEELLKRDKQFSYFDEDDFLDYDAPKVSKKPEYAERKTETLPKKIYDNPVYGSKKVNTTITTSPYAKSDTGPKKFTPTPIISPIYGVLDKNYKKDEVQEKKEIKPTSSYVSRKNADLDSIRQKAFGGFSEDFNLVDKNEVEDVEPHMEPAVDEIEDNLLYDMTDVDKTPAVDKVTLQDAEEYFQDLGLEYNIDYKDTKLEKATGRRVSKPHPIDEIEADEIVLPQKEENTEVDEVEDQTQGTSLEDNLFDLIDSMYEEKE